MNIQENIAIRPQVYDFQPNQVLPKSPGDLDWYDQETKVAIFNNATRLQMDAIRKVGVPERITMETNRLGQEVQLLHELLSGETYQSTLTAISTGYILADLDTVGRSMEEHAARRIQGRNLHIVSDFDGTITKDPEKYLTRLIPGSFVAEEYLHENGRESFHEIFPIAWAPSLDKDPTTYREGGRQVELREGVNDLFKTMNEKNAKVTVLSANHYAFVEGGLDQLPDAKDVQVMAIRPDSILSTEKGGILKFFAAEGGENEALVFIGDGASDLPTLDAKNVVALYFVLEGSTFAKQLEATNATYFTYRDFKDIDVKLREIDAINQPKAA